MVSYSCQGCGQIYAECLVCAGHGAWTDMSTDAVSWYLHLTVCEIGSVRMTRGPEHEGLASGGAIIKSQLSSPLPHIISWNIREAYNFLTIIHYPLSPPNSDSWKRTLSSSSNRLIQQSITMSPITAATIPAMQNLLAIPPTSIPLRPETTTHVIITSRTLPTGSCSPGCACQAFWSVSPSTPYICACNHHACYHSPSPPPSYPLPLPPVSTAPYPASKGYPSAPLLSASSLGSSSEKPTSVQPSVRVQNPPQPASPCLTSFSQPNHHHRYARKESTLATPTPSDILSTRVSGMETQLQELLERVQEWEDFGIEMEDQAAEWERTLSQRIRVLELAVAAVAIKNGSGRIVRNGMNTEDGRQKEGAAATERVTPPPAYQHIQPEANQGRSQDGAECRRKRGLEDSKMMAEAKRGKFD